MRFVQIFLAAIFNIACAHAQTWPARPINILVTTTPGTGIDLLARTIGQRLIERWGTGVAVVTAPVRAAILREMPWRAPRQTATRS